MTTIGVIILIAGIAIVMLISAYYGGYHIGVTKGKELAAIEWDKLVQHAIKHSEDTEAAYKAQIQRYKKPMEEYIKFLETVDVEKYNWVYTPISTFINTSEEDQRQIDKGTDPSQTC